MRTTSLLALVFLIGLSSTKQPVEEAKTCHQVDESLSEEMISHLRALDLVRAKKGKSRLKSGKAMLKLL
jgi:DNA-binding IscR family transcriptional regulator